MSHTESDQARIGLNAVGGDSDGEFAPEETGIVHRTSPRRPPARVHPLAVYLRISLPSGEPVRPEGLSPEEWEDFIVLRGGCTTNQDFYRYPNSLLGRLPRSNGYGRYGN